MFTLAADLMVSAAPPERAGAAAGISETSSELGGALGIAVLGVVGTALYRSEVADTVPAGVPFDAAETARDSLGGAVAAGDDLPEPLGGDLVNTAGEAFTQALQLAATLSAAVVIAAAVLAWTLLRARGRSRARGGGGLGGGPSGPGSLAVPARRVGHFEGAGADRSVKGTRLSGPGAVEDS